MKKITTLIFGLFLTSMASATEVGFSSGRQFTAVQVQGTVTVFCSPGDSVTYSCLDSVLDPRSYDYFVGPENVDADEITLSNQRADGTRRERTMNYDTRSRRTIDAFNLWISTLFQRPLLAKGLNQFEYKLLKRGAVVGQGFFDVQVGAGPTRTCPTTHVNSNDPNDCRSQYSVCQRYFEQYNQCR